MWVVFGLIIAASILGYFMSLKGKLKWLEYDNAIKDAFIQQWRENEEQARIADDARRNDTELQLDLLNQVSLGSNSDESGMSENVSRLPSHDQKDHGDGSGGRKD